MSFITPLLSPFNLLFFVIIAGFAIGRIRIYHISLGMAGILFVAMLVGTLMNLLISETHIELISGTQSTMKTFSTLGTSLFVSVIGLQTGFSIKNNSKEAWIAFAIGALMSISGVLLMLIISALDQSISYSALLGVLCGALTSTPGLSSVCELIGAGNEAAVGYGCSYLSGVIIVVLVAQLFARNKNEKPTGKTQHTTVSSKIYAELILISVTALFGGILGSVKISSLNISFGTTASTLLIGLFIGYIVNKKATSKAMSSQCLNAFKNLGLALFFAGTGFSTGVQTVTLNIKTVIYGVLITLSTVFCGFLLCKLAGTRYGLHKGFIIAGGMTSSPAYGAIATDAIESSINCFSFSYFGALISLIVSIQFICK